MIKPIKDAVKEVLKDLEQQKPLKKEVIKRAWEKIVGKRAYKHTRITAFRSERLIVEVDESGWMYQMTLKKQEILTKLARQLKDIHIREIQFRIGDFK